MADCIFCKIADGSIKSDIIYSDSKIVAFYDINPQAPVHIVLIPKEHVASILDNEGLKKRGNIIELVFKVIDEISNREQFSGLKKDGFRVVTNVGKLGGQSVNHLHFHVLGGRQMDWPPG